MDFKRCVNTRGNNGGREQRLGSRREEG
jgi:hypothetical protein